MFRGLPYMKIVWGVYLWEKTLPTIQIIKQQVCRVLAINPAPAHNKLIVEKLLDSYNIHFQPKTDGCSGAHHTWHLYYPVIFRIWGSFSSSFGRKIPIIRFLAPPISHLAPLKQLSMSPMQESDYKSSSDVWKVFHQHKRLLVGHFLSCVHHHQMITVKDFPRKLKAGAPGEEKQPEMKTTQGFLFTQM